MSAAWLRQGLRPFFLGASLWIPLALAIWLLSRAGTLELPLALPPLLWHQHQTLFGGFGAVLAGFLLTALPNWTGGRPLRGGSLFALFLLWAVARVASILSGGHAAWLAALPDLGFYIVLLGHVARELVRARNRRNFPVWGLLFLFSTGDLLSWTEALAGLPEDGLGIRLGLASLLMLLALIGGRIVPAFTRNWLVQRRIEALPASFGRFDALVLVLWGLALLSWLLLNERTAGALFVVAGMLHLLRLARWRGPATLSEPLVTILHLGYLWLAAGALLYGLSLLGLLLPSYAAIHALTAGALGTMTLAVMTRASLGHTGRALHADAGTTAVYALVIVGTLLRLPVPLLEEKGELLLALSAVLWGGAYLLFFILYLPILIRPGPGPQP